MARGSGISNYGNERVGLIRPLRTREEQEKLDRKRAAYEAGEETTPDDAGTDTDAAPEQADPTTFAFQLVANFDPGNAVTAAQGQFYNNIVDHRRKEARSANKDKDKADKTATADNTPAPIVNVNGVTIPVAELRDNTQKNARDLITITPSGLVTIYMSSQSGLILPPELDPRPGAPECQVVCQNSTARAVTEANGGSSASTSIYDVRNRGWGGLSTGAHQSSAPYVPLDAQLQSTTMTALDNGTIMLADTARFDKGTPYVFKADIDGNGKNETITVYPPTSPVGKTDMATAVYNGASQNEDCETCYIVYNYEDVNGDGVRDFTQVTYVNEKHGNTEVPVEKLRITHFKRPQ